MEEYGRIYWGNGYGERIITICSIFFAFSVAAHPYDEPLTFRKHLTDDGRVIWSNIPKACFSKGLLTSESLHPIYGMPVATKKAASSSTKKTSVTQSFSTTNATTTKLECGSKQSCSEMKTCGEAKFYLNQCGLSSLDGDEDGVPCESIC